jgi:hypothetical protein
MRDLFLGRLALIAVVVAVRENIGDLLQWSLPE